MDAQAELLTARNFHRKEAIARALHKARLLLEWPGSQDAYSIATGRGTEPLGARPLRSTDSGARLGRRGHPRVVSAFEPSLPLSLNGSGAHVDWEGRRRCAHGAQPPCAYAQRLVEAGLPSHEVDAEPFTVDVNHLRVGPVAERVHRFQSVADVQVEAVHGLVVAADTIAHAAASAHRRMRWRSCNAFSAVAVFEPRGPSVYVHHLSIRDNLVRHGIARGGRCSRHLGFRLHCSNVPSAL